MNRHAETNVWNDPRSYLPNLNDQLGAESFQREREKHILKLARQAVVRKFIAEHGLAVALGLVTGMLGTVGVAYVIAWVAL